MKKDMHKLLRLYRSIGLLFIPYCLITTLVAVRNYGITWLSAFFGASVVRESASGNFEGIVGSLPVFALYLAVFIVVDAAARCFHAQTMHRILIRIRETMFHKILTAPLSGLEGIGKRGEFLSRMNQDVDVAMGAFQWVLLPFMYLISGIGATVTIARIYWPFVVLLYAVGGAELSLQRLLAKRNRALTAGIQADRARMTSNILHLFTWLREIRASGLDGYSRSLFASGRDDFTEKSKKAARLDGFSGLLSGIDGIVGNIGLLVAGVVLYWQNILQLDDMVYIYTMSTLVLLMMTSISSAVMSFHNAMAGVDRVFEVMDLPDECAADPAREPFVYREGRDICIGRQLECTFNSGFTAFRDLSFAIPRRGLVALCGESGAGKTTLFRLLPRLYPYTGGSLSLGGQEIRETFVSSLRRGITYVMQENQMIEGTLRDNLLLGNGAPSDDALWEALETVCAKEWVDALPMKLDTVISENANGISGGQRQAVALANGLLRGTPLYLLDEVFAGIDRGKCVQIMRNIKDTYPDRTFIVITHDDLVAGACDAVVRMGSKD